MKEVLILLSTYNGEQYLLQQLESLSKQKGVKARILVRDDGSSDNTCRILSEWQERGLLKWYAGENKGPAQSFMDLLRSADGDADFYAFCDQDDVWLPEKLSVAVDALANFDSSQPNLYCSNLKVVDKNLSFMYYFRNPKICSISKGAALIDYWAAGCTMVFNTKLKDLVLKRTPSFMTMHDRWLFLSAVFLGNMYYDPVPHILYRQHEYNKVGENRSFLFSLKTKLSFWKKRKERPRERTAQMLYSTYSDLLSVKDRRMIQVLCNYRTSLVQKLKLLGGVYDLRMRTFPMNLRLKIRILFHAV